MSNNNSDFDPDFRRGRMAEIERTRRLAIIVWSIGAVLFLVLCVMTLAGVGVVAR